MAGGPVWILYNPVSGSGRGKRSAEAAAARINSTGRPVTLCPSERAGHATEIACEAAGSGVSLLVVVGGDGTLRDVVAGLPEEGPLLALVPAGTGNDLARTLAIPRQVSAAVRVALDGREQPVDVWRWNDVAFLNIAGVGLDAAVADAVNRRLRKLRGTLAYLAGVALTLPTFRPPELDMSGDDWHYRGRVMLTAIANAQ